MSLTGSDYDLDYLFIAETIDGSIIKQTPDDKAKFSSVGTMMTDLMKEHLKSFSLVGKGHIFTIDLKDGHFEVDGNKIYSPTIPPSNADLRPIYWRQVTRSIGADGSEIPKIRYIIGWQYTLNGKNCDWQMAIE
jgi:hypothetical protein